MVSPLIIAACAAVPVVYIPRPAFRAFFLIAAFIIVCILIVLFCLKRSKLNPLHIQISIAVVLGLAAGFVSVSGIEQCATGIPPETITAIKGKLLDDPRSFAGGFGRSTGEERGMALLELAETENGSRSVRCSARGRTLVFFPDGTMPRLREFGRGAEIYVEGRFLPANSENNAGGAAKVSSTAVPVFRSSSVHVIKSAPALERTRTVVRSAILAKLKPKTWGGLAAALLLGTRENLEGDLANAFRDAGLSHILALSGMHLAFLSAMLAFVLKKPLGKKGSLIAGFAFIVMYVFLVGPQPSLVRAAIMYGLGCFVVLTGTGRQSLALLSAAFLIQILVNPASAYSISFILSYSALAGILILSGPILVILRGRLPDYAATGLGASAGAFLVTAPIVTAFFGILRPVGLVAGLIAAPLSGIFMGLSLLWLFIEKFPLLGMLIDRLLSALQLFLQWMISLFARFPALTIGFPAVCITAPLLIIFILIFAERHARYRNELARFA